MYGFFNIEKSNMSLNTTFTEQSHVLQRFYDLIENKRNEFRKIINILVHIQLVENSMYVFFPIVIFIKYSADLNSDLGRFTNIFS